MESGPSNNHNQNSAEHIDVVQEFRSFPSGSIQNLSLSKGSVVTAGPDPEIVVHTGGRGRMSWTSGEFNPDDPKRSWGAILLSPGGKLHAHGTLRAIRVTLPGLRIKNAIGPVTEVLVGLLCRRARYSPEPIAEAALKLVRLLIAEEVDKRPLEEDQADT